MRNATCTLLALSFLFAVTAPASAQNCPASIINAPKRSTLYLYMPSAGDNDFPPWDGKPTSPLNPFDMSQHDPGISDTSVRLATWERMINAWCEFDLQVKLSVFPPARDEERWQVIGVGSDLSGQDALLGTSQDVDTGDLIPQDYSRVWVETLEQWAGGELTGGKSTADRWANAIANVAMHESSHNYGGAHGDEYPQTGEDLAINHFMADASSATPDSIVDRMNHHSDTTYERLGHDLGLAVPTVHNWDFVNPNEEPATAMTIVVLTDFEAEDEEVEVDLSIGWHYPGPYSPWGKPTLTKENDQLIFQGNAYDVYNVKFETAKEWSNGPDGIAPGGEFFHVGVTFQAAANIIVYETKLHAGNSMLPLRPRMFGYDAGTAYDGTYKAKFFNTGSSDLVLSDMQVFYLPRMVDIEEMVVGGSLRGIGGMDVTPFARQPRDPGDVLPDRMAGPVPVRGDQPFTMPLARLTDRRHLDRTVDPGDCEGGRDFGGDPVVNDCPGQGAALSLFPATYTYVMATVTDPNAHYWDKAQRRYVDGPLSTRFFFQLAGQVPDANANGIDDLLDIRRRTSRDDNDNGIPDEAEVR